MVKKAELLEQAKELKLEVTEKNTIAEIEAAIAGADAPKKEAEKDIVAEREAPVAKAGKRSEKAIKEAGKDNIKKYILGVDVEYVKKG